MTLLYNFWPKASANVLKNLIERPLLAAIIRAFDWHRKDLSCRGYPPFRCLNFAAFALGTRLAATFYKLLFPIPSLKKSGGNQLMLPCGSQRTQELSAVWGPACLSRRDLSKNLWLPSKVSSQCQCHD